MARLPLPGGDSGNWGQILNDFLSEAHKSDGSIKDNSLTGTSIADETITESKLAISVQSKLNAVAGTQGATGATGVTGGMGATGVQGATGAQGFPGATGATGFAGPQGATGAVGPQGATGPGGAQGPQGATGVAGATGADGTSVMIAGSVATSANLPTGLTSGDAGTGYISENDGHLHVWSGSSWTDVGEIRGPAGPQGATGSAGPIGATGSQGGAGSQGATGANGVAGATGPSGAAGAQGATGPAGAQGTAGATGVAGPAGATGPVGTGVPNGGAAGQVLTKASATNYDTHWVTPASGGGIWFGTQAEYDALTPDGNVLYVIVESAGPPAPSWLVTDAFSVSQAPPTTTDTAQAWRIESGTWTKGSGQLTAAADGAIALVNLAATTQTVETTYSGTIAASSVPTIVLAYDNSNDWHYRIEKINTSEIQCVRRDPSATTVWRTNTGVFPGSGATLRVSVTGVAGARVFRLWVNGTEVTTLATGSFTDTDGTPPVGNEAGLRYAFSSGGGTYNYQNFKADASVKVG